MLLLLLLLLLTYKLSFLAVQHLFPVFPLQYISRWPGPRVGLLHCWPPYLALDRSCTDCVYSYRLS